METTLSEIPVMFVRAEGGLAGARAAFATLESRLPPRGSTRDSGCDRAMVRSSRQNRLATSRRERVRMSSMRRIW